jgi:hypothetical protein
MHYIVNGAIRTGGPYIATHEGHTSRIGTHLIVTRTNVYGTIVRSKSIQMWIILVGSKMLLKIQARYLLLSRV